MSRSYLLPGVVMCVLSLFALFPLACGTSDGPASSGNNYTPTHTPTITLSATPTSTPTATATSTASRTPTPYCVSPSIYGNAVIESSFGGGASFLKADKITLPSNATAVSISLYVGNSGTQLRMGIYSDSGNRPFNLMVETAAVNIVYNTWNTVALPNQYLPAGTYWLALFVPTQTNASYTSGAGAGTQFYNTYDWGPMPANIPSGEGIVRTDHRDSIYINTCP